jgi:hypothetical protein
VRPFQGDTKLAVLIAVTKETPPRAEKLNTDLSPRVADLLRAMLEKKPKDRPDSATEVITELQDTPTPKIEPTRPSRFPRWAIAAGLLAAAVLVASVVVIIRDKDGKEVARIEVPEDGSVEIKNGKGGADIGKAPPAPAAVVDSDRKAAEYVLSIGGTVRVNDKDNEIKAVADLPKELFRLTVVGLAKNTVVTDAGLAAFKDCKNLTELNLAISELGDAGLAHFKGCIKLHDLDVSGTRVTDVGLAALAGNDKLFRLTANVTAIGDAGLAALDKHTDIGFLFLNDTKLTDASLKRFASLKKLAVLQIDGTAVTDAGLASLTGNTALRGLDVRNTKVTAKGIATLAKALPLCRIQWDGGVIEPKK